MKKVLFAMTAVCALAAAAPAAAQYGSQTNVNAGGTVGIGNRIAQLETRLQAGIQSGAVDRREAASLRLQLRHLRRLELQYSRNGFTQQERMDLQQRIRAIRQDLRLADGGRFDRDNRYGSWDDDDGRYADRIDRDRDGWDDRDYDRDGRWDDDVSDGRYADRVDRNRDGWDDRDYDRDGRWDDDVNAQGGPYEEADGCDSRGGISGVIDSVLGSSCLRVGARATGNLSAVPYEHRNRFRDGGGYYYRYRDGNVYQIDARTQVVARIYDVD
jgi:hypothetical protein